MSRSFSCAVLTLLVCALFGTVSAADLFEPGVCMQQGAKLAGIAPVKIGKGVPQPRKVRNVTPTYPDLPPGTRIRINHWVGELLVDGQGVVKEVWATREMTFIPPFPTFNRALVDALRQWRFEPLVLQRARVPFCMTVTHIVDFS